MGGSKNRNVKIGIFCWDLQGRGALLELVNIFIDDLIVTKIAGDVINIDEDNQIKWSASLNKWSLF